MGVETLDFIDFYIKTFQKLKNLGVWSLKKENIFKIQILDSVKAENRCLSV